MASRPTTEAGEPPGRGWVLFDGECGFCRGLVDRYAPALRRQGYEVEPFQSTRAQALRPPGGAGPPRELLLFLPGPPPVWLGGADALVALAPGLGWVRVLGWLAALPGGRALLRAGYRLVARHRHCLAPPPP